MSWRAGRFAVRPLLAIAWPAFATAARTASRAGKLRLVPSVAGPRQPC